MPLRRGCWHRRALVAPRGNSCQINCWFRQSAHLALLFVCSSALPAPVDQASAYVLLLARLLPTTCSPSPTSPAMQIPRIIKMASQDLVQEYKVQLTKNGEQLPLCSLAPEHCIRHEPPHMLRLVGADLIARGGHGAVYRCRGPHGGKSAVKVFAPDVTSATREVAAVCAAGATVHRRMPLAPSATPRSSNG